MPHLTDDARMAALDPGGGGAMGVAARAHAAECEECRRVLEADREADAYVATRLARLDHPMPAVTFEQIRDRARARRDAAAPIGVPVGVAPDMRTDRPSGEAVRSQGVPSYLWRWGWRGIGVMAFGTAVAAAALVPDSAARRLVVHAAQWVASSVGVGKRPRPPAVAAAADTDAAQRGVSIAPSGPVTIVFRMAQRASVIHVRYNRVYDRVSRVAVQGSAPGASYSVSASGIVVDNRGIGALEYTVRLPALANSPPVRIMAGGSVVYAAAGGRVTIPGDGGAAADSYDLSLGGR